MIVNIVDLACGAGLGARGLIDELSRLGICGRVVFACDPWSAAVESYRLNVPEAVRVERISVEQAIASGSIPHSDLLIAGPPCIRDSVLTACRTDVEDRTAEMASLKEDVLTIAKATAQRFVIETNRGWDSWGRAHGLLPVRVSDHELGGYTLRRRTFLLHRITPAPTRAPLQRGWGEALPQYGRTLGCALSSDVHAVHKRQKYAKSPDRPAFAVVGHGGAPILYCEGLGAQRLPPEDALRLQGFHPGVFCLASPRVRDRQTLVGNGWPRSYGQWLARSYAESLAADVQG